LLPLPVPDYFKEEAEDGLRERHVIAVGRWDAPVKRPELLAAVIRICLNRDRAVSFTIVGGGNEIFTELQKSLAPDAASRIELKGIVSNEELVALYRRSRTLICTSAYEGYHISSAEALCSGCSVVAPRHPLLPALEWYASRNSGSLAAADSAGSLADALFLELDAWDAGMRAAYEISRDWRAILSATQVSETLKTWIIDNNNKNS
jgi:glycosyltransferase involved in cell wall biosynthesis